LPVFFQIVVQIWATAKLKNGAEAVVINFHCIIVLHDASIVELLMDFIFPQRVLYVVVFDLVTPTVVKVVNFASDFPTILQIERLINLREPTLAKDR